MVEGLLVYSVHAGRRFPCLFMHENAQGPCFFRRAASIGHYYTKMYKSRYLEGITTKIALEATKCDIAGWWEKVAYDQ